MSDDFGHLQPGAIWKPTAFEVNAMKDAARKAQGTGGIADGGPQLGGVESKSFCVRVKNTTAADIDRYTCFSLGEPRWEIDDSRFKMADVIWELVAYDAAKPACITLEPIKADEFGMACINGPALVKVASGGSATDRVGSPNSSGELVTGSGAIQLAHSPPTTGGYVLAILGLSNDGFFAATAEDFYPGRDFTWCYLCDRERTQQSPLAMVKVYHWQTGALNTQNPMYTVKTRHLCVVGRVAGKDTYLNGIASAATSNNCINFVGTPPAISLDPASGELTATVGTPFTFSNITGAGLDSAILDAGPITSAGFFTPGTSSLPPGLTLSAASTIAATISGTPTTAGTYYSFLRGRRVNSGTTCDIYRMLKFVINP